MPESHRFPYSGKHLGLPKGKRMETEKGIYLGSYLGILTHLGKGLDFHWVTQMETHLGRVKHSGKGLDSHSETTKRWERAKHLEISWDSPRVRYLGIRLETYF